MSKLFWSLLAVACLACLAGVNQVQSQPVPKPASQSAVNTGSNDADFVTPRKLKGAFGTGGVASNAVVAIATAVGGPGGSATNAIGNSSGVGTNTYLAGATTISNKFGAESGWSNYGTNTPLYVKSVRTGELSAYPSTAIFHNPTVNLGTFGYENGAYVTVRTGPGGTNWMEKTYLVFEGSHTNSGTGFVKHFMIGAHGGPMNAALGQFIMYNAWNAHHFFTYGGTNTHGVYGNYGGLLDLDAFDSGSVNFNRGADASGQSGRGGVKVWSGGSSPTNSLWITRDGRVLAKHYSFNEDTNSFIASNSDDAFGFTLGGNVEWVMSSGALAGAGANWIQLGTGGQYLGGGGSASLPLHSFLIETNTGMYLPAYGQLGLTVSNVAVVNMHAYDSNTKRAFVSLADSNFFQSTIYGTTLEITNLIYGTNISGYPLIDFNKKRTAIATNGNLSFTGCILPDGWATNYLSTMTTISNSGGSSSPLSVTMAAPFQRLGGSGNTFTVTNLVKLVVDHQFGVGTNWWVLGR